MILLRELLEIKNVNSKKVGSHKYIITYNADDFDNNVDEAEIVNLNGKLKSISATLMETFLDFDTFYTDHVLSQILLRCIPEELIVFIFEKAMPKIASFLSDFSRNHELYSNKRYIGIIDRTTKINIIFSLEYKRQPGKGFTNTLILMTIMPKDNFVFFHNTTVVEIYSGYSNTQRIEVIGEAARIAEMVYRRKDLSNDEKHELEKQLLTKLKNNYEAGILPKKRIENKFKKIG